MIKVKEGNEPGVVSITIFRGECDGDYYLITKECSAMDHGDSRIVYEGHIPYVGLGMMLASSTNKI